MPNVPFGRNEISPRYDLTGRTFAHLTVLEFAGYKTYGQKSPRQARVWLCQCVCGETTKATSDELRGNRRRSCGCRGQHTTPKTPQREPVME